jgi:hypothetical protein
LPKKRGPSEHQIQTQIIEYLETKHVFFYRQNTGGAKFGNYYVKFGIPGAPDIVAVIKGHFFGIEVKDVKGKQSEKQIEFMNKLRYAGGTYILARSLDDVTPFLTLHIEREEELRKLAEEMKEDGPDCGREWPYELLAILDKGKP